MLLLKLLGFTFKSNKNGLYMYMTSSGVDFKLKDFKTLESQ